MKEKDKKRLQSAKIYKNFKLKSNEYFEFNIIVNSNETRRNKIFSDGFYIQIPDDSHVEIDGHVFKHEKDNLWKIHDCLDKENEELNGDFQEKCAFSNSNLKLNQKDVNNQKLFEALKNEDKMTKLACDESKKSIIPSEIINMKFKVKKEIKRSFFKSGLKTKLPPDSEIVIDNCKFVFKSYNLWKPEVIEEISTNPIDK